jgi:hypothetical protein
MAVADGWTVTRTGGDHLRFDHELADGPVFTGSTPSDYRAIRKAVAMMKRALPREPKAPAAAEHRSGWRCSASVRMRGRGMQDDAMDGCIGPLHHVAEVLTQRRQQYGPPAEHFKQVARRWSLTLGTTVRSEQVVLCLLDLKVVRLAHDPGHRDSLVDLIGYSVLLHELVGGASAQRPAEVAELAEPAGCTGFAAAEAPLKSAEVRRSAG